MSDREMPISKAQRTVYRENRDAVIGAIRDLGYSYVSARHLRKHAGLDIPPTLIGHTLSVLAHGDGPLELWNQGTGGAAILYRVTEEGDGE